MERITQFTRDGLTFDVRDEGPLDGAGVVLLHGFPEDSSSWNRVAPLLHAHGLRTIAPDHRGYSPGARPSGVAAYHLDELVADVLALLDAVGEPVHLVGHDWGGGVAWQVAGQHPERPDPALCVPATSGGPVPSSPSCFPDHRCRPRHEPGGNPHGSRAGIAPGPVGAVCCSGQVTAWR